MSVLASRSLSRRRFLSLAGSAAAGALIAACAPPAPAPAPEGATPPPAEKEKVKLTAWFTDRRTINEMTKEVMKSEFQARNPNIEVDIQFIPEPDIPAKMATAYQAGQAPDLSSLDETHLPGLWSNHFVKPIPEGIIDVRAEMGARVADVYKIPLGDPDAKYYALPNGNMTSAVHYNEELLDQYGYTWEDIPTKWEDFIKWAQELTIWDGDEVKQWGFTFAGSGSALADAVCFQLGGWTYKNHKEVLIDSPEMKEAYQFVLDLFDKYKLDSRFSPLTPRDRLGQGQAVTAYEWTWVQGFLTNQYPDLKWGTVVNPTFTGEPPYGRASDDLGFAVTTQTEDPDRLNAIWTLWRYLVGPDYQRRYVKFRGTHPSLLELWDEPDFTPENPRWRAIAITTQPGNYRAPGIWPIEIVPLWGNAWTLIRDEGVPIDEAVAQVKPQMQKILEENDYSSFLLGKDGWEANPIWMTER
ncbi:MAG: extracellular solute-binding protein [Chloroflexi bacterium]|nr:extracellular solute-binding protein [Chloroflexota bacterium]